jgi:hypothetical protein
MACYRSARLPPLLPAAPLLLSLTLAGCPPAETTDPAAPAPGAASISRYL